MNKSIHIILAQKNLTVGDITENKKRIIEDILFARDKKNAQLIIFPELSLTAYPPEDLLLRANLHKQIRSALSEIEPYSQSIDIIIGYPDKHENILYNACSYLSKGQIQTTYHKQKLPNYGVFDEKRYFAPGRKSCLIDLSGIPTAITICEDLWSPEPTKQAKEEGAELLININASPYRINKSIERQNLLKQRVQENGLAIIYTNLVGGQDELVFDGDSMALNNDGEISFRAPQFEEGLCLIEVLKKGEKLDIRSEHTSAETPSRHASIYNALVLGTRDYVNKNGFKGALIGLSGGIDSALTLAVAVDALGAENVEVFLMPSQYTSDMSNDDAKLMAETLRVSYNVVPIEKPFAAFTDLLAPIFTDLPADITEENIQARCRGVIMMAISNKTGKLVLTTGNKSEMAVGYATLYGDMAGGFAPLKDLSKTLVFELCKWRNSQDDGEIIPQRIIDRPPSAELRPDQKDEDSLPPYDILDPILERYIELDQSPDEIIKAGFEKDTVLEVVRLVDRNEYKRQQAAPGVRITKRAFGRDRRYPITSGYREF